MPSLSSLESAFIVESTLSSPCSRSDPPFSRQGAVLAHLDSLHPHDLILWTDGSVPFPFGKGGSGVLANCSLRGTEATLSFSAGLVCSSFSAEACITLRALAGLGSTNKSAIFFLFSSYLTLVLSSPPCPLLHLFSYLKLCGRCSTNCLLSSCSIRLQWVPGHSFLPGNDVADELVRRGALLVPPATPCSLSPLISRIHSCLFSDWRHTVSSKFLDTHKFPRFPLRNLRSLVMLAVSSLVYAAMDTAFC